MEVIPAIDLRGGRCVRLYQGDYDRETVFSDDPMEVARRWVDLGARRLHVIDLDGAKSGEQPNAEAAYRIAGEAGVPVQLGGGIRSVESARQAIERGIDRVLLGTAAVEEPDLLRKLVDELGPERVVVTVDARDGKVALKGWTETSEVEAEQLIRDMRVAGVSRYLYTDISRDGTLTEPNFDALERLTTISDVKIIAAGGISSVEHLSRLRDIGVESAVVGTAIYTGDIDLGQAIAVLGAA
ncbi:MAG: 1-(5-phosphoribosyl)-5-[(5-phosphoribosylamino)methylideneamino]imidazole-4-carboxamide isomerase [Chloroflexi bacterium]|nr:1-(5-phosphoribosyl)-5-[(5-phosphoribosylamino)methylideneamino]imidazole-4-carboxamide isomerase [Chloroflexota bacterium]